MPVYIIQAGDRSGPVKIGHGQDPQLRLVNLQLGNHLELRIIRLFEGAAPEEAMLHARFADLRIRGEWHSFSRLMMGDLGLVEVTDLAEVLPIPPGEISGASAAEIGAKIAALRASRGMSQIALASIVKISRSTLASIERGHDFPGRATLLRLCTFFDVPFSEIAA